MYRVYRKRITTPRFIQFTPLVSKPKRTYYIIAIYLLNSQLNTVWNKAYVVCLSIADPRNW